MGVRHKRFPLFGVQFHPESFLTDCGPTLLERFLAVPSPNIEAAAAPGRGED